jgi:hypothetical protein
LLNIDDFKIKRGSLNFIIGRYGSGILYIIELKGKTALLNAILNELE